MEFDLIEIRRHTEVHRDDVIEGIGDDAAVVAGAHRPRTGHRRRYPRRRGAFPARHVCAADVGW